MECFQEKTHLKWFPAKFRQQTSCCLGIKEIIWNAGGIDRGKWDKDNNEVSRQVYGHS